MTRDEKFIYLAQKAFFDKDIDGYIASFEEEYVVSIYEMGGRTMYPIKKEIVKTPVDVYFETYKLIGMLQFKKEEDGFIVQHRVITATTHGKEFNIGIVIENPDCSIIVKLRNDIEDIYEEYPYLNSIKDHLNYGFSLLFEKYQDGRVNLFKKDVISEYITISEVKESVFSERENIQNALMRKSF